MFAGKKSAQIREILISESAWEEMTCLFAPSLTCDSYLEWIHDTPYGCVIRMYDFKRHLLALKRGGVSKFLRK
ncbi:hypothetical protein L7H84_45525, partial [Klebsiella pneumoniae]|nr:hypothetical protein [Klebsiella pneumoniae]